jgi:hypothetical protein
MAVRLAYTDADGDDWCLRDATPSRVMEADVTESESSLPRGAVVPPIRLTAEDFDRDHGETAKSELLWRVSSRAYCGDSPTELQAWGGTTWWTLGRLVSVAEL